MTDRIRNRKCMIFRFFGQLSSIRDAATEHKTASYWVTSLYKDLNNVYTRSPLFLSHKFIHCLKVAITTPEGGSWGYRYIEISPSRWPTRPRKGWKCCEGDLGFSSLSDKTRKCNGSQMSLQRPHFLLSYLKTLSIRPSWVQTRPLPPSRPALCQLS